MLVSKKSFDWWAVGTTAALVIAVALLAFSMIPEMVSNDLTAQMTPEMTEPSRPHPPWVTPRVGRIGVAEGVPAAPRSSVPD